MSMGPLPQLRKKTIADMPPPRGHSRTRARKGSFRPRQRRIRDVSAPPPTKKHTPGRTRTK